MESGDGVRDPVNSLEKPLLLFIGFIALGHVSGENWQPTPVLLPRESHGQGNR